MPQACWFLISPQKVYILGRGGDTIRGQKACFPGCALGSRARTPKKANKPPLSVTDFHNPARECPAGLWKELELREGSLSH